MPTSTTKNATKDLSKQTRNCSWHYDKYRYSGGHAPKQWSQGAPYFLGYWYHGVCRSVLERSGWALFFFIPIEAAWLFYDFGFRRIKEDLNLAQAMWKDVPVEHVRQSTQVFSADLPPTLTPAECPGVFN
ncbi:hypothetical protein DIPPA_29247 [Diplonema papillatum]|nr:hypothetical protein DIPPA_29247 [Diplonema papillatum]